MQELKKCPFCGGEAEIVTESNYASFVRCKKRCCRTYAFISPKVAVEAWNERGGKNMKLDTKIMELNIKEGHAVAFDFDGVIHKYSKGWQDGSIYDEYNRDVLDLILILNTIKVPVFILSTREPEQIKEWWGKQGFTLKAEIIEPDTLFFNNLDYVGITRAKLPAQIYVDDRAYCYTGQTVKEFLLDFCME